MMSLKTPFERNSLSFSEYSLLNLCPSFFKNTSSASLVSFPNQCLSTVNCKEEVNLRIVVANRVEGAENDGAHFNADHSHRRGELLIILGVLKRISITNQA